MCTCLVVPKGSRRTGLIHTYIHTPEHTEHYNNTAYILTRAPAEVLHGLVQDAVRLPDRQLGADELSWSFVRSFVDAIRLVDQSWGQPINKCLTWSLHHTTAVLTWSCCTASNRVSGFRAPFTKARRSFTWATSFVCMRTTEHGETT